MNIYKNWEYGSLGIYNPNSNGSFANLFNYLKKNINDVEGDIVEFGVYKGHSLLSIAYFLKEQGSEKEYMGLIHLAVFRLFSQKMIILKDFMIFIKRA